MQEDDIRKIIEEIDPEGKIPQSKIEELVVRFKELETNPPEDGDRLPGNPEIRLGVLDGLKAQLANETDWRKRSALAAKIISLGLE